MAKIVIEGSLSPSAYLARGERREVQDDARVQNLIRGGYVNVISSEGEVEPAPLPEPVPAPKRNASRDDWAEWLAEHTDVVTEGKDRDQLLADYDEWQSRNDAPSADDE
ncbi:hypothetical protein SEA_ZENTENO07_28 [Mycobacterium phage Zenteno07]|nr:hypothetical protein SEA_ZENTENO07_28 [Mycobacterium phage Zenteno07]